MPLTKMTGRSAIKLYSSTIFLTRSLRLTSLFLGFRVDCMPVEVCYILSSASALNLHKISISPLGER